MYFIPCVPARHYPGVARSYSTCTLQKCLLKWWGDKTKEHCICPTCRAPCNVSERLPGATSRQVLKHRVLYFNEGDASTQQTQATQRGTVTNASGVVEEEEEEIEDDDMGGRDETGRRPDNRILQELRDMKAKLSVAEARSERLAGVKDELDALKVSSAAAAAECEATKRHNDELQTEIEQLRQGQPDLRADIERRDQDVADRELEIQELKEKGNEMEAAHAKALKNKKREISRLKIEATGLEAERDKLKLWVKDAGRGQAQQIQQLKLEKKELDETIAETEHKHDLAIKGLENKLKNVRESLAEVEKKNATLDSKDDKAKKEKRLMESGLKSHKDKYDKLKGKYDLLKDELANHYARRGLVRDSSPNDPSPQTRQSSAQPPTQREQSPVDPLPFKINNRNGPLSRTASKPYLKRRSPPLEPEPVFEEEDDSNAVVPSPPPKKKQKPPIYIERIVITDSEDEKPANGSYEDEEEDFGLPTPLSRTASAASQAAAPFKDGMAKKPLTQMPSDKHLPSFASGNVPSGGPKTKVKFGRRR
ncbi:hypothetical protein P7C70_g4181, partial [Phenoliferia sp. Uapishka_3]